MAAWGVGALLAVSRSMRIAIVSALFLIFVTGCHRTTATITTRTVNRTEHLEGEIVGSNEYAIYYKGRRSEELRAVPRSHVFHIRHPGERREYYGIAMIVGGLAIGGFFGALALDAIGEPPSDDSGTELVAGSIFGILGLSVATIGVYWTYASLSDAAASEERLELRRRQEQLPITEFGVHGRF